MSHDQLSGAEIMAHKPIIRCKLKSHKRQPWSFLLKAVICQLIELESCSNCLKTWKVL